MWMKRVIALLIAVVMVVSLAACNKQNSNAVYWLNFKPELDETLQTLAKRYQEEKGVTVKVVTPESGTYQQTLASEMEQQFPPTMFVLGNQQEAKEWESHALDLKGTSLEMALIPGTNTLGNEDGKITAMPYCTECFGIVVNPKLLKNMGYSVEDINSFDKLKEIAEVIHNNKSWLGYDAFCSHDLDADNSWRLTAHMANIEYCYEERAASVSWQECPSSLTGEYVENYKNLYDLCLNNSISSPEELAQGGHNPVQEFKDGKAAFLLTGSWDYANITQSVADAEIIPYYCGVKGESNAGLNSGSENYWAVNSSVDESLQKATVAFMRWLVTDPEASAALAKELGNLPYEGAPESDNGFLAKDKKLTSDGKYSMKWMMTYQPNSTDYRAELVAALKDYNNNQSDDNWSKVRKAMIDNWAEEYVKVYNK